MTATAKKYRNEYVSVSRLKTFERCPKQFELQYVRPDKTKKTKTEFDVDNDRGAGLGSVVHEALQELFMWADAVEHVGVTPEEVLLDAFREAYGKSELRDEESFNDGLALLRAWCKRNPQLDSTKTLGIEIKFKVPLSDDHQLLGFIDRVDKVDNETIRIVDYKTNRLAFTRDDVDTDLQMSGYGIAARFLWPWAKHVEFAFDMLRHGYMMQTERSEQQLDDAQAYMVTLADRTESGKEFEATLNSLCSWCRHSHRCEAFTRALESKTNDVASLIATDDDDAIARERQRLEALAKAADKRRKELDRLLKAKLKDTDALVAGGYRFTIVGGSTSSTPTDKAFEVLRKFDVEFDPAAFCKVEKKALDAFVASLDIDKAKAMMLKAELGAIVERKPKSGFVTAKKA